jgi:hypothetical protein
MPCYEQRTTKVAVEKMNLELLAAAMKEAGYHVWVSAKTVQWGLTQYSADATYTNGVVTYRGTMTEQTKETKLNELKRSYSKQVVKETAKRFGWIMNQDKQNNFKFEVTRRS